MKKGSSELLLLDVNVLLAIAWPNHQFHRCAIRRLERSLGWWATCALTQLGFIRLSSTPAVVGIAKSPWESASLLTLLVQDRRHRYVEALPSPTAGNSLEGWKLISGSKQVTDAYLLSLARRHGARLLTFDSRLAFLQVNGDDVEVLTEY
jgi:hypothetical protein